MLHGVPFTSREHLQHQTVLNATGRVWTMVAGGGASVVYADTLTDLGAGEEMANYGEYSGMAG